jgi:transposase-like protein
VTRDADAKEGVSRPARKEVSYSNPSPADRARELILRTGLSQRAVARELEVDDRTLRYWCSGAKPVPRIAILALERLVELKRTVTDNGFEPR